MEDSAATVDAAATTAGTGTGTGGCTPLGLGSVPLLVYDHGIPPGDNRQTAFSVADGSLRTHAVPELTGNDFHATPHGWVFLHDCESRRARLWDPRSGATVALPPMDDLPPLPVDWKCYLSEAPTAPSCVVLVLCTAEPRFLYCRVGGGRWSAHDYDIGDVALPPEYAPPRKRVIHRTAAVGGKFYFRESRQLGVIEFSPEPEFSYLDFTAGSFPFPDDGSNCVDSYLVASHGELFHVSIFFNVLAPEIITAARVYKLDVSGQTVSEVTQLGDKVFLLSYPNEQLVMSASSYGLKGNRIYVMHNVMAEPDGGSMYIYDLDDQSLEIVRPCQDMKDLMCNPFWMMPIDS